MSPPLRELVIPLVQPFLVAREPSAILLQHAALQLLAVTLFGLLLGLTGGKLGIRDQRLPAPQWGVGIRARSPSRGRGRSYREWEPA
jgi:hypothetical protein